MILERQSVTKFAILMALVIQTSATVILFRLSLTESSEHYLGSTVVLLTECLKYLLCIALLVWQEEFSIRQCIAVYLLEIVHKPKQTALLGVPAILYTLQNNILIIALKHLDAATFQVSYQLKILTTAGFSVMLLGRKLPPRQWLSLVMLAAGVALVQIPATITPAYHNQDQLTGLFAVLVACFSSGFAGVYYEKLLKTGTQPSIIIRNLQLGIFSILLGVIVMLFRDLEAIHDRGLLQGYTAVVWTIVVLQAVGGLVVAATIKYADNIVKGFGTSLSIILSAAISWLLIEDLQPGRFFLLGTSFVLVSSAIYSYTPTQVTTKLVV